MGRFSSEELANVEVERQPQSRQRGLQFSYQRDLPMILTVRNASFISYRQLSSQLMSQGSEFNRKGFSWRLNRLVAAGVIQELAPMVPFPGPVYTISRQGLACLEACGEGLISLISESKFLPNPRQATHYLELVEIRGALRRAGLLVRWIGDLELKSMNLAIDQPLAKDYDAVADVVVDGKTKVTVAIEYERTVKAAKRYEEIVETLRDEREIQLLLYLTASTDLVYQLKGLFEDLKFPIAVGPSGGFCADPMGFRMHNTLYRGQKKATLVELIRCVGQA
jgi:hypothetical protein